MPQNRNQRRRVFDHGEGFGIIRLIPCQNFGTAFIAARDFVFDFCGAGDLEILFAAALCHLRQSVQGGACRTKTPQQLAKRDWTYIFGAGQAQPIALFGIVQGAALHVRRHRCGVLYDS